MTEKTPTLGSLETSDYTKRQLALQSLEFNLQNKIFLELFPELCAEIRDKLKDLQAGVATASSSSPASSSTTVSPLSSGKSIGKQQPKEESPILRGAAGAGLNAGDEIDEGGILRVAWGGAAVIAGNAANICVILGFAVFAYTVRYVLGTVEH